MTRKISWSAIASLVLGLIFPFAVSNVLFGVPSFNKTISFGLMLTPFVGVLLGHAAKVQIRRANGEIRGLALANTGLALSYAQLLFFVAALMIYRAERFPLPVYESSAVGSLRTLNFAMHNYAKTHPQVGFPSRLEELSWDRSQPETPWGIDQALASGVKSHYRFTHVPKSTKGDGVIDAYQIDADPVDPTEKDLGHFFVDQTEAIRMSKHSQANESSLELK